MRQLFIILFTICILPTVLLAQKQSNVWIFGGGAGVDFSSGNPVSLTASLQQNEGSASISDRATGRLLFYTSGTEVWNRNNQPMPNGRGLISNTSATQAAVIVPKPGSATEYYVFTVDAGPYTGTPSRGLFYSIVDMRLDGGLGDVTVKNISLLGEAQSTEKLLAIEHCNGRDYWLLAHKWNSNEFVAYRITRWGISPPVVTAIGSPHQNFPQNYIGWLQSSSDGQRVASAIYGDGVVEVFDFDNYSGAFSKPIRLAVDTSVYGVCFSPDGSRLYATARYNGGTAAGNANGLYQFDLSSGQQNTIATSRRLIWSDPTFMTAALQLGPNGKIYMAREGLPWLGVINNPNAIGAACNFQPQGVNLAPNQSLQGLPNIIATFYDPAATDCRPPLADFTRSDTLICQNETIVFTDKTIDKPTDWDWNFPGGATPTFKGKTPPAIRFPNPGVFDIRLIASNENGADTSVRRVTVVALPGANAGPDVGMCIGESRQLSASGNGTFRWSPATGLSATNIANPVARPTTTTAYTLTVTNEYGCVSRDTVTVTIHPLPTPSTSPDTTICSGNAVQISASGGVSYQWSPATGLSATNVPDPVASPTATTMYRVTVTNQFGCSSVDSVRVRVVQAPTAEAGDDRYLCLEESATLLASGNGTYTWSPATGLSCTTCKSPVATPGTTTTYHLTVTNANGCQDFDSVTVHVDQAPRFVRTHIDRDYVAYPGMAVRVPVMLDDPLDSAYVTSILFTLRYEAGMLVLTNGSPDMLSLLTGGTLLEGWNANVLKLSDGEFSVRFTAPSGEYLNHAGVLMNLHFLTYLGSTSISPLPFQFETNGSGCTRIFAEGGMVRLDSVCGMSYRLINATSSSYLLSPNTPNPFAKATTITFSLGLDGPTKLEIYNGNGKKVATLIDRYLDSGRHQITWDATSYPSGIYMYRLTSGTFKDEKRMVVQ